MSEPKYKIGDKVRIVNYGHLVWENKECYHDYFLSGMTGGKEKPNNIIKEDDCTYWVDIRPDWVGQETMIKDVNTTQDIESYSTTLFSWATPNQLELINR